MRTAVHTGLGHLTPPYRPVQLQAQPKASGLRPPTRPQWGSLRVFATEEKWGDLRVQGRGVRESTPPPRGSPAFRDAPAGEKLQLRHQPNSGHRQQSPGFCLLGVTPATVTTNAAGNQEVVAPRIWGQGPGAGFEADVRHPCGFPVRLLRSVFPGLLWFLFPVFKTSS